VQARVAEHSRDSQAEHDPEACRIAKLRAEILEPNSAVRPLPRAGVSIKGFRSHPERGSPEQPAGVAPGLKTNNLCNAPDCE